MKKINILICSLFLSVMSLSAQGAKDEFPIMAWTGIKAENAVAGFEAMKGAGINIYIGQYGNLITTLKVLDAAQEVGVKMITGCPALAYDIPHTVNKLMKHPALYGYDMKDEPETVELAALGRWMMKIQAIDNDHPCYINLYPNWAWGKEQYAANVNLFLDQVPTPILSFDYYPIVSINGNPTILRPEWYRNLEEISVASKERGLPIWAFALALSHHLDAVHFYPVPTLAELRLQVFSNLAYGAQAIQYFTLGGIYQQNAPTPVYDLVKTVNQEVRQLADIFLGANVISVWHTGAQLPEGTKPIDKLPNEIKSLKTSDSGAVVSFMENNNNQYLVVVNRDYRSSMNIDIDTKNNVSRVSKKGTLLSPEKTIVVEPGDMIIYTWKK